MPRHEKWAKFAFSGVIAFCAMIGIFSAIWIVWSVGPSVERSWQPVVGKLQVLDAIEIEPGVTEIHARFRKIRDCNYLSVAWYVGNPNSEFRQVRVQTMTDDASINDIPSPNRPLGWQSAGPWRIAMSLNDFENNSFAILTHQCHPFWVTTTNFYP